MPGPVLRDRRTVGRPGSAQLHRYSPSCGRGGTQWRALLADTAWWNLELERRPNALADRKRAFTHSCFRPARTGSRGMGRRIVPCARIAARALDNHP